MILDKSQGNIFRSKTILHVLFIFRIPISNQTHQCIKSKETINKNFVIKGSEFKTRRTKEFDIKNSNIIYSIFGIFSFIIINQYFR